jgi:hypothetical protein
MQRANVEVRTGTRQPAVGVRYPGARRRRLTTVVLGSVRQLGLIVAGKEDWVLMHPDQAADLIGKVARRTGVELLSTAQRDRFLMDAVDRELGAIVPQRMPAGLRRRTR